MVVCSVPAAFEAWFQVELACILLSSGGVDSVRIGYDYPGGGKADLQATDPQGLIIFEPKCFVCGADANKKDKWPVQLARLRALVEEGAASHGVALSTYFGYSDGALSRLVGRLHPSPWRCAGPSKFLVTAPLEFVVATVTRQVGGQVDVVQRAGSVAGE